MERFLSFVCAINTATPSPQGPDMDMPSHVIMSVCLLHLIVGLQGSHQTLNACFPGGSDGKESAAVWETWVRFLGQEDPLEKEWQPTPVFWPGWLVLVSGAQQSGSVVCIL